MAACFYGTKGTISNPWDEACKRHEAGEVSMTEMVYLARQLFDGEELDDVLADLAHRDLSMQPFVEGVH